MPSIFESFIVFSEKWCDGIIDCPNSGEDESLEKCPNRFRCKAGNRVSIASSKICDGVPDCDDLSDEINNICLDRFFCPALNNTKVSKIKRFVANQNQNTAIGLSRQNIFV